MLTDKKEGIEEQCGAGAGNYTNTQPRIPN